MSFQLFRINPFGRVPGRVQLQPDGCDSSFQLFRINPFGRVLVARVNYVSQ